MKRAPMRLALNNGDSCTRTDHGKIRRDECISFGSKDLHVVTELNNGWMLLKEPENLFLERDGPLHTFMPRNRATLLRLRLSEGNLKLPPRHPTRKKFWRELIG